MTQPFVGVPEVVVQEDRRAAARDGRGGVVLDDRELPVGDGRARAPRWRRRTAATRRRRRGGSGCRSPSSDPRPTSRRSEAVIRELDAGVRVEAVDRRADREVPVGVVPSPSRCRAERPP